ncbi:MAG: helix-turn-helix domain-containing protein [Anaerolineae bacterium]
MSVKTITPLDRLGHLPFQPTVTSSNLGWSSLRLEDYRYLPASDLKMPPMNHHIVAFHYKPPTGVLKHGCGEQSAESVMSLNDITYVPARIDNSWEFGDSQPHCLHILIEDSFFNKTALTAFDIDPVSLESVGSFQIQDARLQMMAQLFHTELYQQGQTGPLYVESLTTALTIALLHNFTNLAHGQLKKHRRPKAPQLGKNQLRQIHALMHANLERGLSLQQMADEVALSTYHFSRLFKASMGISPNQYLLQLRLDETKRLLLQSPKQPISAIAQQTGFTDQAYLTRQFRQHFGITPARFRDQYA